MKISRRENLDRYYLLKLFGFAVFLHRIHHDEKPGIFHTHPWNGFSIIFGSYKEQYLTEEGVTRLFTRRWFNVVKATIPHRVEVAQPVWTLFFHGRKCNSWQVIDKTGKVLATEPWEGTNNPERKSYA